jgi:glycerophosphoryl diester phosphodiesterase
MATSFIYPKTQIHRGFWLGGMQENSIDSFRAAKAAHHAMIELDVQFSKDQKVVVYHDPDLKRLFGIDAKVASLTAEELKQKAKIPTLDDVLSDPKIPSLVNIEIKRWGNNDEGLELGVKNVIDKNQAFERVIISSFDETILGKCAELMPNVPRAFLVAKSEAEDNNNFMKRIKIKLETAQTKLLHINHGAVRDNLSSLFKEAGWTFSVWTLDDEDRSIELLNAGALSIITNRVDMKL